MNAHRSQARKRRLAHARGLRERWARPVTLENMCREVSRALHRCGWNPRIHDTSFGFLRDKGFPCRV